MSDSDKQIAAIILDHIAIIENRFSSIKSAEDFIDSQMEHCCWQAIGEIIKKQQPLIKEYPVINWNDIIRFRDFLSHHYEWLEHEIVFNICRNHLPVLKAAFASDLKN